VTTITLGENVREVAGWGGVKCFIANATLDGTKDAFFALCRRAFDVGHAYYFPRQEEWRVRDPVELYMLARDAAIELFGAPNLHDIRMIGDLFEKHVDELHYFPPDSGKAEAAQLQRQMELSELVVKINDKVLVDAR